jgi:hypothetical protein
MNAMLRPSVATPDDHQVVDNHLHQCLYFPPLCRAIAELISEVPLQHAHHALGPGRRGRRPDSGTSASWRTTMALAGQRHENRKGVRNLFRKKIPDPFPCDRFPCTKRFLTPFSVGASCGERFLALVRQDNARRVAQVGTRTCAWPRELHRHEYIPVPPDTAMLNPQPT